MFLPEESEKNKQISFLENLLENLRDNNLSLEKQRDLTEFYLKMEFKENNHDSNHTEKYMALGWYIYEILIYDEIII